jgi:hypothetical protein
MMDLVAGAFVGQDAKGNKRPSAEKSMEISRDHGILLCWQNFQDLSLV